MVNSVQRIAWPSVMTGEGPLENHQDYSRIFGGKIFCSKIVKLKKQQQFNKLLDTSITAIGKAEPKLWPLWISEIISVFIFSDVWIRKGNTSS